MSVAAINEDGVAEGPRDLDGSGIAAVESALQDHVETRLAVLLDVDGELEGLSSVLREATTGGKRLRAAFCLWGARGGAGGEDVAGAVQAAAALELFHLAALVHDDLMDHSAERRGRPTVHRHFADRHTEGAGLGDAEEYGAAVAVLAGDLCLTWSDDLLAESLAAGDVGRATTARDVWSQMRDQVLAGQYLDVLGQTRRRVSPTQVRRVLHYKSAKYTVEHPLLLGAALAGAGPELQQRYSAFGVRVGEAFQLRDDVLGVFGSPGVTGKPAVDDVREGKRTLLVAYAEDRATPAQHSLLQQRLGDPQLEESDLAGVQDVLVATGALARVEDRIGELVAEARLELAAMRIDERSRSALASLTDACAWRAA